MMQTLKRNRPQFDKVRQLTTFAGMRSGTARPSTIEVGQNDQWELMRKYSQNTLDQYITNVIKMIQNECETDVLKRILSESNINSLLLFDNNETSKATKSKTKNLASKSNDTIQPSVKALSKKPANNILLPANSPSKHSEMQVATTKSRQSMLNNNKKPKPRGTNPVASKKRKRLGKMEKDLVIKRPSQETISVETELKVEKVDAPQVDKVDAPQVVKQKTSSVYEIIEGNDGYYSLKKVGGKMEDEIFGLGKNSKHDSKSYEALTSDSIKVNLENDGKNRGNKSKLSQKPKSLSTISKDSSGSKTIPNSKWMSTHKYLHEIRPRFYSTRENQIIRFYKSSTKPLIEYDAHTFFQAIWDNFHRFYK